MGNLLLLLNVRALADHIGVESVTIDGGYGVLRLQKPVGGARPALEKELAGLAEVGNTQIRVPWNLDDAVSQDRLLAVLEKLVKFKRRLERLDTLVETST